MDNKYIRECPNIICSNIITYSQLYDKTKADNKGSVCDSWEENLKKSNNCYITLDELINDTSTFLTKNNKILINHDF
jgi:hypothetical protein